MYSMGVQTYSEKQVMLHCRNGTRPVEDPLDIGERERQIAVDYSMCFTTLFPHLCLIKMIELLIWKNVKKNLQKKNWSLVPFKTSPQQYSNSRQFVMIHLTVVSVSLSVID